jgi:hypothetical protein
VPSPTFGMSSLVQSGTNGELAFQSHVQTRALARHETELMSDAVDELSNSGLVCTEECRILLTINSWLSAAILARRL